MNERYILLGISAVLTMAPLAVLGLLGLELIRDGFALENVLRNMSLDTLMIAVVSKIFALVFALLTIYQAGEAGLIPKFWKAADKKPAKK